MGPLGRSLHGAVVGVGGGVAVGLVGPIMAFCVYSYTPPPSTPPACSHLILFGPKLLLLLLQLFTQFSQLPASFLQHLLTPCDLQSLCGRVIERRTHSPFTPVFVRGRDGRVVCQ